MGIIYILENKIICVHITEIDNSSKGGKLEMDLVEEYNLFDILPKGFLY
jgi:hypothetical protein